MILVVQIGAKALFARKSMNASRKTLKVHQNVLVFVKGNPKKAATDFGECIFKEVERETEVV
jgi:hypothetical protein